MDRRGGRSSRVLGFAEIVRRRTAPRERYRGATATGLSPVGVLDVVASAVRELPAYEFTRHDTSLTIRRHSALPDALTDNLVVHAERSEVGTRVDIYGFAEPELISCVRGALARTPPWMSGFPR